MSKKNRHFHILKLIGSDIVESQQTLLDELEKAGISISQSTLSKDLKELGKFINNELRGIIIRRVLPGNCDYCPI